MQDLGEGEEMRWSSHDVTANANRRTGQAGCATASWGPDSADGSRHFFSSSYYFAIPLYSSVGIRGNNSTWER